MPLPAPSTVIRDMTLLYPKFASRVVAALESCHRAGYPMEVFETWRSAERQLWLYEQGRSRPGAVVTNAKPWESAHALGLAVDVAARINGSWTWDFPVEKVSEYFLDQGLETLAPRENCHWQLLGIDIKVAVALMRSSGLQRLWIEIDAIQKRNDND